MRPGREIDTKIATEVFGHKVWARGKILLENPPQGERPLRKYSREIEWAWEVAVKMNITLIPIVGGQWFAFIGPEEKQGWNSPTEVLQLLEEKRFAGCGADFSDNAALAICSAALKAIEKRRAEKLTVAPVVEDPRPELQH
jgi:hypothetical protein